MRHLILSILIGAIVSFVSLDAAASVRKNPNKRGAKISHVFKGKRAVALRKWQKREVDRRKPRRYVQRFMTAAG